MTRYHPSLHRILAVFLSILSGLAGLVALCALLGKGTATAVRAQGLDTYSTYYVAPGADCGGETPCYASIQEAVDAVDDPADVVKVAAGTYTGVHGRPRPAGYNGPEVITQVVFISKSLALQGGYTTTDWSTPDPEEAPTTIDAQEAGRVICIAGDISVAVEGFQITEGNAHSLAGWQTSGNADRGSGGGIYVLSATVTLQDNHVLENRVYSSMGGGIFVLYGDATIQNNTVVSNVASWQGGGLGLVKSTVQMIENTIEYNRASENGGGLHVEECAAILNDNVISHNTAGRSGGGIRLESNEVDIHNNFISENTANYQGGGLSVLHAWTVSSIDHNTVVSNQATWGGGIHILSYSYPFSVSHNRVTTNTASYGGGIGVENSLLLTLDGNDVVSNTAEQGGAVYFSESQSVLANSILSDNQVSNEGSGVYVWNSWAQLVNNTLARNRGGGGVYVTADSYRTSTVWLTNTILVSHTVGLAVTTGSTATMETTLWGNTAWGNDADWGGTGTILKPLANSGLPRRRVLWYNSETINTQCVTGGTPMSLHPQSVPDVPKTTVLQPVPRFPMATATWSCGTSWACSMPTKTLPPCFLAAGSLRRRPGDWRWCSSSSLPRGFLMSRQLKLCGAELTGSMP